MCKLGHTQHKLQCRSTFGIQMDAGGRGCCSRCSPGRLPPSAGQHQAAIDSCNKTIELSDRNACDVELLCVG